MARPRASNLLTEKYVRYVCSVTDSNMQAATFAEVSYNTWKQYASMYIDSESGKDLFTLQKEKWHRLNPPRYTPEEKAEKKRKREEYQRKVDAGEIEPKTNFKLTDILAGKHPKYSSYKLKQRLRRRPDIMPYCCRECGYSKRTIDGRAPLLLDHINYNWKDHRIENLRWLCLNCYYMLKGLKPTTALKFGRILNAKFGKKMIRMLEDEAARIAFARQFKRMRDDEGNVYWVSDITHVPQTLHDDIDIDYIGDEIRKEAKQILEDEPTRKSLLERLENMTDDELDELSSMLNDELGELPDDIKKAQEAAQLPRTNKRHA